MLPTLKEGEIRLTIPCFGNIKRNDLVLYPDPNTGATVVKRAVGLPGERVFLTDGDLYLDGQIYRRPILGPADLIPLVDVRGKEILKIFRFEGEGQAQWNENEELLVQGKASLSNVPMDGFLLDGQLIAGVHTASDLGIAIDFSLQKNGSLEIYLREGAQFFTFKLEGDSASLSLNGEELEKKKLEAPLSQGALFLVKADGQISAILDEKVLLGPADYESAPGQRMADGTNWPSPEQAGFGGKGFLVRRIQVGRDLFRHPTGTYGSSEVFQLGEGEYFLLGDNHLSEKSIDSRFYGSVSGSAIRRRIGPRLFRPSGGVE